MCKDQCDHNTSGFLLFFLPANCTQGSAMKYSRHFSRPSKQAGLIAARCSSGNWAKRFTCGQFPLLFQHDTAVGKGQSKHRHRVHPNPLAPVSLLCLVLSRGGDRYVQPVSRLAPLRCSFSEGWFACRWVGVRARHFHLDPDRYIVHT